MLDKRALAVSTAIGVVAQTALGILSLLLAALPHGYLHLAASVAVLLLTMLSYFLVGGLYERLARATISSTRRLVLGGAFVAAASAIVPTVLLLLAPIDLFHLALGSATAFLQFCILLAARGLLAIGLAFGLGTGGAWASRLVLRATPTQLSAP